MFYCEPCGTKYGYPTYYGLPQSYGPTRRSGKRAVTAIECPHCQKMFDLVAVRNHRTDGDKMTQTTQRVLAYIVSKPVGAELYCWEARAQCGSKYRRSVINALGYFARAGRIERLYRGCYKRVS